MILEVLTHGIARAVRLPATQIVIRQDNGTPIVVAAEFGPDRSQKVVRVGDPEFNDALRALGVNDIVICDDIIMPPPPPGARLVAGPRG